MDIKKLISIPTNRIPPPLTPKSAPEIPNTANIKDMIVVTTIDNVMLIIIKPKYVAMQLNHPILSIASLISLKANALDNNPLFSAM